MYFGFHDQLWTEKFSEYTDINRMSGFNKNANLYSFPDILDIIKEIKAEQMDAFVTLNANVYNSKSLQWIEEHYFSALKDAGASGVIVSTESIAKSAINAGLNVVASTILGLYNSDIIKYYYSLGIKRIIVPRDLSLMEIAAIHKEIPDVELEVFFMRRGCIFSDGFCLGAHRKECGSTCGSLNVLNKRIVCNSSVTSNSHLIEYNDSLYHTRFHYNACGMCAMFKMREIGIASLKIVGRADDPNIIVEDIKITKANLDIMKNCKSENEFLEKMIIPRCCKDLFDEGLSCYYPEIRF